MRDKDSSRPIGTAVVQFRDEQSARECAKGMAGFEPPGGPTGRKARLVGVQKSDREFDIAGMTDKKEFQSTQGPRVSADGDIGIIKPSHPYVNLPYISQGYDDEGNIGSKEDLIRVLYNNDVEDKSGSTVPEWMILAHNWRGKPVKKTQ